MGLISRVSSRTYRRLYKLDPWTGIGHNSRHRRGGQGLHPAGNQVVMDPNKKGVQRKILKRGSGKFKPSLGQYCTVHYVGTLEDGTEFDNSRKRGKPFVFRLGHGEVIKGWDEGVAMMNKGELCQLTVPSDWGYSGTGMPPLIPPDATLIFEIELIKFES